MKKFAFILCCICVALSACNKTVEDSVPLAVHELTVQFIDNEGKNMLDSLLMDEIDYVTVDSFCDISCIRLSDGQKMYMGDGNGVIYPRGLHAIGKAMHISFCDMKIRDEHRHYPTGRAEEYDETYLLKLSSPVLFGDSIVHTINTHVHVNSWRYEYRGTEVDGQPLEEETGQQYAQVSVTFVIP